MSFRNRCQLAGGEGIIDLSVPLVKGRDQKTIMKDVRIAGNKDWQGQHWKTIVSCYNRSPWFEFYRNDLEQLYRRPVGFLVDWNLECFQWSCRALGIGISPSLSGTFQAVYDEQDWVDLRGKIMPKTRAKEPVPAYRQVFGERTGFLPNLSILDLLFCEGPGASGLLS